MSKPRHHNAGFANTPKKQATKNKPISRPAHHAAKENLAVALLNQGRLQEAEAIYRQLIAAGTTNHIVYGNLATIYGMQSKLNECIDLLRKALKIKPNFSDAYTNLGIALKEQGELTAAINSYNRALELKPDDPDTHYNLGIALKDQGDITAAISAYNKALHLKPDFPDALNNLGIALKDQGDITAAISAYNKALHLKPNFLDALKNLGIALEGQGDLDAAIVSFNKALELKPNCPDTHNNLGIALREQGDLTAAIDSFNAALQLKPNDPAAHNNLGNALQEQGEVTAAISCYNNALQLEPNDPDTHYNLGVAFKEQGDLTTAIGYYKKALELNPYYAEAHLNSALAMLLGGDYKNGWEKFEWRTEQKKDPALPHAIPQCDQWSNEITLDQINQLLLVTEQGLGDTLQFMRYAIDLKNKGISISFCAQPKLHSLIQASGIDPSPLTPKQANAVTQGQWIPLLSVSRLLKVSPENPIITEPYIKTTNELNKKWSGILGAKEKPVVGITWQGNPRIEKGSLRGRSLALETFAPIADSSQISILSLQKGFGSEQLETCTFKNRFVSCQDQINNTWDFLETAAIISNCDLVITSDTSVAHLAGGMGKTTWLLLHKVPDWRWGLEGDTTFWYPSMRLFRQTERGNWHGVMKRVAEALKDHFSDRSKPVKPTVASQTSIKPQLIQDILCPISLGELVDKITILQIKSQHLQGTALENVETELDALKTTLNNLQLNIDDTLIERLKKVNQDLWEIEDDIRDQERQNNFGETFIRLARSVYQQNDRRAAIKRQINITHGSPLTEEKSYKSY